MTAQNYTIANPRASIPWKEVVNVRLGRRNISAYQTHCSRGWLSHVVTVNNLLGQKRLIFWWKFPVGRYVRMKKVLAHQ